MCNNLWEQCVLPFSAFQPEVLFVSCSFLLIRMLHKQFCRVWFSIINLLVHLRFQNWIAGKENLMSCLDSCLRVNYPGLQVLATASHYWPLDAVDGIHELWDQIGNRPGYVNGSNISMCIHNHCTPGNVSQKQMAIHHSHSNHSHNASWMFCSAHSSFFFFFSNLWL